MAVRDDFSAGEVLAAADLNDTFGSKVDYATPTNAQTGTAYTFVADDAERITTASNGSAVTFTIPPQSSVGWGDDTILRVVNYGAGALTVAGGSGVTVTNTATTIGQYEAAAAIRTGSDAWTLVPFGGKVDVESTKNFQSFTGSGSFTVPQWSTKMYYLVVGGGSTAGRSGGEVVQDDVAVTGGTTITVTVGGAAGNSSVAVSGGSTYTATGSGGAGAGSNGTQPSAPFNVGYFGGGGGNEKSTNFNLVSAANCTPAVPGDGSFVGGRTSNSGGFGGGGNSSSLISDQNGATAQSGSARAGAPNSGGGGGGSASGGSGIVMLYFS